MQHIIVHSARPEPLKQGNWEKNKAGLYFSTHYGFGLMDVSKMVSLAKNWTTVPPLQKCEFEGTEKNKRIPRTVSVTVKSCSIKFLEHVQIKVDLDFHYRGDLSLKLRAPSDTRSQMTKYRHLDQFEVRKNLTDWVITTLFHWGESPIGTWELEITDLDQRKHKSTKSTGTLHSWSLILYGMTDAVPVPTISTIPKSRPTEPPGTDFHNKQHSPNNGEDKGGTDEKAVVVVLGVVLAILVTIGVLTVWRFRWMWIQRNNVEVETESGVTTINKGPVQDVIDIADIEKRNVRYMTTMEGVAGITL